MNITQPSFYVNDLEIPQAIAQPSIGSNTPTATAKLTDCITYVERKVLLGALGLANYNLLQTALADLPNAAQKWKDLVNGVEYDEKVWIGLKDPKSVLCYIVRHTFLDQNSTFWSTMGITKPESENSTNFTPAFELATMWQKFIEKYQKGCAVEPVRFSGIGYEYADYYGSDEDIDVSLLQYLRDKSSDFGFEGSKFRFYDNSINSFGL